MTSQVISAENALLMEQERNRLYPEVHFGTHVFVGRNVTIGAGSIIGHNVVLHDDCTIGSEVRIDDGSIIGKLPLRSRMSAVTRDVILPPTYLGDGCLVGSNAIIYRGARIGDGVLIADLASVREETVIGDLTIIGRGVAVENQVNIGRCCKIETGAYITAKSTIGELCFVAPEVTFTNDNYVGRTEERFRHFGGGALERGARVGANATILPGVKIGADALIGAGSVVTRDVPAETVVFGSPAKSRRKVSPEQLLPPATSSQEKSGAQ
jgi:UDP-2-acetamido-3-amino-2,3-dideoxy-glucuronate N-acetyltransferase